ncbi:MAG: protease-4 [Planctomycetota bacterium]|jgi:protease-4
MNTPITQRTIARFFSPLLLCLAAPVVQGAQLGAHAADARAIQIVELKGTYAEHPDPGGVDPAALLMGGGGSQKSFFKLCDYIDELANLAEAEDILFDLSAPDLAMNSAQLAELDRHMQALKAAGKKTWAWLENSSSVHYSIASSCDTIVMSDFATLDMPSMAMGSMHFKDAFDLYGVSTSTTRVGEYKGATEPFTRSELSDHLRGHYREMLASMNGDLCERMARNRGLEASAIRNAQSQRLWLAKAAMKAGLVDAIAPLGGADDKFRELVGSSIRWIKRAKKGPKTMNFFELMGELMGTKKGGRLRTPGIAILHLEGMIMDGSDRMAGMMISAPTVEEIQDLQADPNVRGVVVRVDSGGGSATASESIRQALAELSARKPLVYSMGSVAGSGGYWITQIGRTIYAEPQTITGSIGVLALKLDFGKLMERVGINLDSVELDSSAGMFSMTRGWSEPETAAVQAMCDDTYERFLKLVSDSRGMSVEDVDAVAGGRIWSGRQALELGLIDRIGGVGEALAQVAEEAGLSGPIATVHRPAHPSPFEALTQIGNQEQISLSLAPAAFGLLERLGLRLETARQIALASLKPHAGPQLWLVGAAEIVVR